MRVYYNIPPFETACRCLTRLRSRHCILIIYNKLMLRVFYALVKISLSRQSLDLTGLVSRTTSQRSSIVPRAHSTPSWLDNQRSESFCGDPPAFIKPYTWLMS